MTRTRPRFDWLPVLVLWASCVCLHAAAPPAKGLSLKQLQEELQKLAGSPALQRASFGVAVMDLTNGEWLFDHNADGLLSVASNNKLATTAAALDLLGPDFQFRTTVCAVGRIVRGTLEGDLLVVGRGDPSISGRFHEGKTTAVLEKWADAVAAAGIKTVRGGILADDTYFDHQHHHPMWPEAQQTAWYCASVSALSFNDNCVLLTVKPGAKRDAPAIVSVDPPTGYVQIVNQCHTSRARVGKNTVLVNRRLSSNLITVSGEIREQGAAFQTWVTVHEPALYAITAFRDVLQGKGITVGGTLALRTPTTRIAPADSRELITTASPLKDAVEVANGHSHNFYAEQILKTLAREKKGQGSFVAGAQAVEAFLRTAGVTGVFSYNDGSGLARPDRFSPRQIVQLLKYMAPRPTGKAYIQSLAEPGEAGGTLARRLDPLKGRIFAKTGYIAGVSALSGYVEARRKRRLAFSILVNDFRSALADVRKVQDSICLKLAEYEP